MISTGIQSRARVYKKCPRCESLLYCTPHGIKHKSFFLARIYTVQCTSVCRFVPGPVEDTRTLQNTAALAVCYQLANLRFRCERDSLTQLRKKALLNGGDNDTGMHARTPHENNHKCICHVYIHLRRDGNALDFRGYIEQLYF